jgi:hypothetical protein
MDKMTPAEMKAMKPMTKKSTDPAKKAPAKRLVKGSKEAKEYMASIRNKKK